MVYMSMSEIKGANKGGAYLASYIELIAFHFANFDSCQAVYYFLYIEDTVHGNDLSVCFRYCFIFWYGVSFNQIVVAENESAFLRNSNCKCKFGCLCDFLYSLPLGITACSEIKEQRLERLQNIFTIFSYQNVYSC